MGGLRRVVVEFERRSFKTDMTPYLKAMGPLARRVPESVVEAGETVWFRGERREKPMSSSLSFRVIRRD
jgi:hypothetical protein